MVKLGGANGMDSMKGAIWSTQKSLRGSVLEGATVDGGNLSPVDIVNIPIL